MTTGLCVNFKDFKIENLTTKGAETVSGGPDASATAIAIPINYNYSSEGKELLARLVIECPQMKTSRGIQPPKDYGAGTETKKPAIPVVFDMTNPDHSLFVGTFGNQYEFEEDSEGRTIKAHQNPEASTGVLGGIYDWSIEQYAKYLASLKGRSTPSNKNYEEAAKLIEQKNFLYIRKPSDASEKGKPAESPKPMKYFKLLSYAPGTPEENSCKFYLPDKTRVDASKLYNQGFIMTPFLSFRRIYSGKVVTVQMEITEVVIHDFLESVQGISIRSSRLIEHLQKDNPDQARIVAEKYRHLTEELSSSTPAPSQKTKPSGCQVDDIEPEVAPTEEVVLKESTVAPETRSSRRPKMPEKLTQVVN